MIREGLLGFIGSDKQALIQKGNLPYGPFVFCRTCVLSACHIRAPLGVQQQITQVGIAAEMFLYYVGDRH